MELNDGFSFGPGSVFHASRPKTEGSGWKFFCAVTIECFSGGEVKRARNHSHTLGFWMNMRRYVIAVRKLKAYHERTFFRWSAFQHSHLRPGRQSRWSLLPFASRRSIQAHV